MSILDDPTVWRRVADDARLLTAAAEGDPSTPAHIARLRRHWPEIDVRVALELLAARRKAAAKGFEASESMLCDVAGVEQATSAAVARHKSERFDGNTDILDLCCGVGGDTIALARHGHITAIDLSPVRALMAGHNASCPTRVADVTAESFSAEAVVHIDPSRRDDATGRRRHDYAAYRPGPDAVERLIDHHLAVAVKLGPGIDIAALPPLADAELEFISERGQLVQAVLWTGDFVRHAGARTATLIGAGGVTSLTGRPEPTTPWIDDLDGRRLITVDPAIERAGLLGLFARQHDLGELHPGLGILVGLDDPDAPGAQSYHIIEALPWRERHVQSWLRAHDGGLVTVKTRDGVADTDQMQRAFRGDGETPYVVFALRLGTKRLAIITTEAE